MARRAYEQLRRRRVERIVAQGARIYDHHLDRDAPATVPLEPARG